MKIGISIVRKENITIFIFHLSFLANQAVTRKIQRFKKKKKKKKTHTLRKLEERKKEDKNLRVHEFKSTHQQVSVLPEDHVHNPRSHS